jgi:HEAT repeat protein
MAAAVSLGNFRDKAEPAVPALIDALRDPSETVRRDAAFALGCVGKAAVPPLLAALKDKEIRVGAMDAIGRVGYEAGDATPALVALLKDSDPLVRGGAVAALGHLGSAAKAALPDMIAALKDENGIVRAVAANAFLLMGDGAKSAVPALLEAAKDKVSEVRKNAISTLELIDPEAAKKAKQ